MNIPEFCFSQFHEIFRNLHPHLLNKEGSLSSARPVPQFPRIPVPDPFFTASKSPEKSPGGPQKGRRKSSNHHFSGVNSLFIFGGGITALRLYQNFAKKIPKDPPRLIARKAPSKVPSRRKCLYKCPQTIHETSGSARPMPPPNVTSQEARPLMMVVHNPLLRPGFSCGGIGGTPLNFHDNRSGLADPLFLFTI